MNGEGISLVGPNIPFGFVGGFTPGSIPFAGATGLLTENNPNFRYLSASNTLFSNGVFIMQTASYIIFFAPNGVVFRQAQIHNVTSSGITPHNVTLVDDILLITTGAGAFICNLPSAVGLIGLKHTIKKVDAGIGAVTITPAGAETIQGAPNYVLPAQWNSVTLVSDGANWIITAAT